MYQAFVSKAAFFVHSRLGNKIVDLKAMVWQSINIDSLIVTEINPFLTFIHILFTSAEKPNFVKLL